jgi:hypothetical protein
LSIFGGLELRSCISSCFQGVCCGLVSQYSKLAVRIRRSGRLGKFVHDMFESTSAQPTLGLTICTGSQGQTVLPRDYIYPKCPGYPWVYQYLARLGKVQSNNTLSLLSRSHKLNHGRRPNVDLCFCALVASHMTDIPVVQHFLNDGSVGVI